jgi:hypothetical protein
MADGEEAPRVMNFDAPTTRGDGRALGRDALTRIAEKTDGSGPDRRVDLNRGPRTAGSSQP